MQSATSIQRLLQRPRCCIFINCNNGGSTNITRMQGRSKAMIYRRHISGLQYHRCYYSSAILQQNNDGVGYDNDAMMDFATTRRRVSLPSALLTTKSSLVIQNNLTSIHNKNQTQQRFLSSSAALPPRPSPPPPLSSSSSQQDTTTTTTSPPSPPPPPLMTIPQTRQNAEMLFDALAPHLEYRTLRALSTKIDKFIQKAAKGSSNNHDLSPLELERANRGGGEYGGTPVTNLISKLDDLLLEIQKSSSSGGQQQQQPVQEEHEWIKPLLLQFFIGQSIPSSSSSYPPPIQNNNNSIRQNEVWNHKSFIPNVNRQKFAQDVQILSAARLKSVQHPLFWSMTQRKKERRKQKDMLLQQQNSTTPQEEKREKGEERYVERSALLYTIHNAKSDATLQSEAEALVSVLADRLPASSYLKLMETFALYAGVYEEENEEKKEEEEKMSSSSSKSIRILYPHLQKSVKFHVHLVAKDVADFFYVDVAEAPHDDEDENEEENMTTATTTTPTKTDPRIEEAWKDWNAIRDEFVQSFLSSQTYFVDFLDGYYKEYTSNENEFNGPVSSDGNSNKKGAIMRREEMENTIQELEFLRTRPADGIKIGRDRTKDDGKDDGGGNSSVDGGKSAGGGGGALRQRRVHLYFDAIMLHEDWTDTISFSDKAAAENEDEKEGKSTPSTSLLSKTPPPANRTIFIDNLPIDIDEEEIFDLYSRCGPIESVTVFNLRPDLDPGPPTGKRLAEKKRRNRLSVPPPKNRRGGVVSYERRRRQRQQSRGGGGGGGGPIHHDQEYRKRTPVYAIVTFATEDGYRVASDQHLSIFGLVLRRHPIRSIQASTMTTLYIENIPPEFYSLDLEYKLSRVLHPDIYVCLDVGQNDYSEPKSCEILFPSFEVAYYAFLKLSEVDMGSEDCVMNWMKTSEDAMGYWTRELGFDL